MRTALAGRRLAGVLGGLGARRGLPASRCIPAAGSGRPRPFAAEAAPPAPAQGVAESPPSGTSLPSSGPPEPPSRRIVRLTASASLHAEPDLASAGPTQLPAGEYLEADTKAVEEASGGWLLVRSPLEDKIEIMSEKPLEYQDGWLHKAPIEDAEFQLGSKVAALVHVPEHPVLEIIKKLPPWNKDGVPLWMKNSVAELYTGKVFGIVKKRDVDDFGRFLVQRPSGSVPERVATTPDLLVGPKVRAKQTCIAGALGLVLAGVIGGGFHAKSWVRGDGEFSRGKFAWPQLVGWFSISALLITPIATWPCYIFANSQASTVCVVCWINLLLYADLFNE